MGKKRNADIFHEDGIKDIGEEWNANQIEFQRAIAPADREPLAWSEPDKLLKQLCDRFEWYLQCCEKYNKRVGNLTCYTALGIRHEYVSMILNGTFYRKLPSSIAEFLNNVIAFCGAYREALVSEGKINPVTGIFWQKNFDGLKDTREIQTNAQNPLIEASDVKRLEDKYSKLIVVDAVEVKKSGD